MGRRLSEMSNKPQISADLHIKVGARQSLPLERFISLIGHAVPLRKSIYRVAANG